MNGLHLCVYALFLAVLFPVTGCARDSEAPTPPIAPESAIQELPAVPVESDVQTLLGKATMEDLPGGAGKGEGSISDRILDGFEAGPSHLQLDRGNVIYWGFKFQEASQQSVVIYDAAGQMRLAAAVDDIIRLTVRGQPRVASMAAYRGAVERSGLEPGVFAFVRDEGDLKTYLPILKRWLQADLLGFNVDCGKPGMPATCELAARIAVPMQAYAVRDASASPVLQPLPVPGLPTAPIALSRFVQ